MSAPLQKFPQRLSVVQAAIAARALAGTTVLQLVGASQAEAFTNRYLQRRMETIGRQRKFFAISNDSIVETNGLSSAVIKS